MIEEYVYEIMNVYVYVKCMGVRLLMWDMYTHHVKSCDMHGEYVCEIMKVYVYVYMTWVQEV